MKKASYSIVADNLAATHKLGKKIGGRLRGSEIFALSGNLGAGKTSFVQGIAEGLGVVKRVISPTFVLERIYTKPGLNKAALFHYDLYRIESTEATGTDLFENIGRGVVAIEWAEKIKDDLPAETIWVNISQTGNDKRKFSFDFNDDQSYLFN